MICLDTNVVIAYLRERPTSLIQRMEYEFSTNDIALSVITLFELRYGAAKSKRVGENRERLAVFLDLPIQILQFDAGDAEEAGEIRAYLERTGQPIGQFDLLIAAQARRRDAILVTANTREFARVPRLRVESWV